MKRNIFLFGFFMLFLSSLAIAQSPEGFNYQAVARDANGDVITDEFISIRFWLLEDGQNGSPVYREVHSGVFTGPQGIFTLEIGDGNSDQGNFENIDWGGHRYFLRVDLDVNNGNNFQQMGTSQLLSVPYAMYAKSAGNAGGGDDDWGNQVVQSDNTLIGDGTPGNPLRVNVNQVNTDDQTLSINGNQLSISNGNTISIPTGGTDADADPLNEIQTMSITNPSQSNYQIELDKNGGTVSFNVNDADSDPNNEKQNLSLNGRQLSISDGNSVTLPADGDSDSNNELQNLSINGNQLSISNGNTVSIPTGGTDADADPLNEIQTLSITNPSQGNYRIELDKNGGQATFNVNDADSDPNNENQTLSIVGNQISISNGNTISIPTGGTDADADPTNEIQSLAVNGRTLSISSSNSVQIPEDGDADAGNELQNLNVNGRTLSISNGNQVTIPEDADADPSNEFQNLNLNGRTLSISNGNQVTIPNDADADPANEIQSLSVNGNQLTISGSNTVTLPSSGGNSPWNVDGNNDAVYDGGNAGATIVKEQGGVEVLSNQNVVVGTLKPRPGNEQLGIVEVFGNGTANAVMRASTDGYGQIFALAPNGQGGVKTNVLIGGSGSGFPTQGQVAVYNQESRFGAIMTTDDAGAGRIVSRGFSQDIKNVELTTSGSGNLDVGGVWTFGADANANPLSYIGGKQAWNGGDPEDDKGEFAIFNSSGNKAVRGLVSASGGHGTFGVLKDDGVSFNALMGQNGNGAGFFQIDGATNNNWFFGSWNNDNPDNAYMIMSDEAGNGLGFLFIRPDDGRSYATFNEFRSQDDSFGDIVRIGEGAPNAGLVDVLNSQKAPVVRIFAGENTDEGIVEGNIVNLLNPTLDGINVGLGHGNNVNRGQIFIANEANDPRAGMFYQDGNTAIVFADVKNFRMDDPEVADQEIWYASLEGPEAGAYDRGTATLENGEVTVTFSEHFMKVVNENKMTVQLTPLSAESLGLAVVEKTATGFKVKELHKGEGNYSFDWMVHSQRTGFEDYQVVRKKDNSQVEKMMQDRVPARSNEKIEMPQAPARDQY
jgi:hypothetical protein